MTLRHLVEYINQVFKPCTLQGNWSMAKDLPLYLQGGWAYQVLELDGHRCLLMLDEHEQPETAQRLKKTINKISNYFEGPVIYGVSALASYNRKRLIDQGIAFVVPAKQLYLPFMALDLRENFAAETKADEIKLGACAQQLILVRLFGLWQIQESAQALANKLGVSKMTVSRAYRELSELGLAQVITVGRSNQLVFDQGTYELWELAIPKLVNPIKREVWIDIEHFEQHADYFQLPAGEQALAQQGMLGSPKNSCYAIAGADWNSIKRRTGIKEQVRNDNSVLIQLWRYDPSWINEYDNCNNRVDQISLYLSLQNQEDERIHIALDEMMQEFWKEHRG